MLQFLGRLSKSWFGPLIIGSSTIAFIFLGTNGVRSLFNGSVANAVVQAGNHVVTVDQFQKIFQRNEQEYLQRTGQPYPLEQALAQGADRDMVTQLASETAYLEMLSRAGIRPSADVVASEIRHQAEEGGGSSELSQVFDPVTGKFKPDAMRQLLSANGITLDQFQRELVDSIADQDFTTAVRQGFEPPRIYTAIQATLLLESRDVSYFVLPETSIPQPAPPTDAQLSALIDKLRDQITQPERRKLTVVRFSAKALAPTMPVDQAAVQQQFDAKRDTYGKPETRSLVEIPLNDPTKAAQVVAALNAGQDPTIVAKSVGVDAVSYTDQPQTAIADRKVADAAFLMTAGQVVGPVQGDLKTVVIKLIAITPAQAPDINAARAQIVADLQMQEAIDKVYDLTQKFEDLVEGGSSAADAAAKLGLTVETVGPVTAEGKDIPGGQTDPVMTPKLLQAAFQLPQGGQSEDVEQDADKGEYFFVHVDQVLPPGPPALDEPGVRPALTQAYYQNAVVDALKKEATDAQAALAKGQTMEAVAGTYHAQVAHQLAMTRVAARQLEPTLGQEMLGAVFDAKSGATFAAGSEPLKGLVVGRVDAVHPGDPKQIATLLEELRQRSAQAYMEGLDDATHDAASHLINPHTDLQLAHQAMGVDDAMLRRVAKGQTAPPPAQ